MKPYTAKLAVLGCWILAIIVGLVGLLLSGTAQIVCAIATLIIGVGGGVIHMLYGKCTGCGRVLPFRGGLHEQYCPYCGQEIE